MHCLKSLRTANPGILQLFKNAGISARVGSDSIVLSRTQQAVPPPCWAAASPHTQRALHQQKGPDVDQGHSKQVTAGRIRIHIQPEYFSQIFIFVNLYSLRKVSQYLQFTSCNFGPLLTLTYKFTCVGKRLYIEPVASVKLTYKCDISSLHVSGTPLTLFAFVLGVHAR